MAIMMGHLYAALRDANVPDDRAQKAAEEVASYENRIVGVEAKLDRLDARVTLLTWMLGTAIGLILLVLGVVLRQSGA